MEQLKNINAVNEYKTLAQVAKMFGVYNSTIEYYLKVKQIPFSTVPYGNKTMKIIHSKDIETLAGVITKEGK